ncbi:MAG: hypothetical protein B7Y45_12450 [Sphingomonas sp. 28-66-16]|nr:MAG: hypothetical protein B7Y45_12450 [Sphingomonas sp. 28-66-16]
MPFAKLFRSRWSALLWAGGILWTAYDVAGAAPSPVAVPANGQAANADAPVDVTGTPVSKEDLAVLAHFGDGGSGNH